MEKSSKENIIVLVYLSWILAFLVISVMAFVGMISQGESFQFDPTPLVHLGLLLGLPLAFVTLAIKASH